MGYTDKLGKRIQEEVARYQDHRETVRASILEVLTVRFLSPDQMHPNPEDEFCKPEVGMNREIVSKYRQDIWPRVFMPSGMVSRSPCSFRKSARRAICCSTATTGGQPA